jgi:trimeric autotransporter adhesin
MSRSASEKEMKPRIFVLILIVAASLQTAPGQTSDFTYQGKLVQSSVPANGNYDIEFKLYNAAAAGTLVDTKLRDNVSVANGIFTVRLDFSTSSFDGTARYLEISVRATGSGSAFQQLLPRQQITSTPYAVRSLSANSATTATNASQLGGVAASQYVLTGDSRLTDARNPLPNNPNYIQNTSSTQASSNFSISGNGTAGTLSATEVNATTQFNIGGVRVLSSSGTNLFVGTGTGPSTVGPNNSFFGRNAGSSNTGGSDNSFFGNSAGRDNTLGSRNSYFGLAAGRSGDDGNDNAIFGYTAGLLNEGNDNSLFGSVAGSQNTIGNGNSFFGKEAGAGNTIGGGNSFFGHRAGSANKTGNTNSFFGANAGDTNVSGSNNTLIGNSSDVGSSNLENATAIGAGAVVTTSNTVVLGTNDDDVRVPGSLIVVQLGTAGSTDVCRNASNFLSTCSSSLRYKNHVQPFTGGLNLINRLRPITFNWIDSDARDVGFGAEDVEKVDPLLVVYDQNGRVEGVKYKQLTAVLVNAIREQQARAEKQDQQIAEQKRQIEALKKLVCLTHPNALACK